MKLQLLIREMNNMKGDGQYIRENFRRLEQYINDLASGKITVPEDPVQGNSPSAFNRTQVFQTESDGQTNFILNDIPAEPEKSQLYVNSILMTYGTHYTIVDNQLIFNDAAAGYTLEVSNEFGQPDQLVVHYIV